MGFDNLMNGSGSGYSLQGGMAQSGNTSGSKTNGQTINFGSMANNDNTLLYVGLAAVAALIFIKK